MKQMLRNWLRELRLPDAAKAVRAEDRRGLQPDPGNDRVVRETLAWLGRAQDESPTADGGVARHYSLVTGWGASYPETTGYIIPTLLLAADRLQNPEHETRARRMLDWLVGIQLDGGGFQGGMIDQRPVVPVTFNTGQILIGLAVGAARFGEPYMTAARRAADWLVETQDADGAWRDHPTPFAEPGEKTYETHVAWGLVEAAKALGKEKYLEAARRNGHWALSHQQANGWMANCCLSSPDRPLTHTLGYVLRGLIEIGTAANDPVLIAGAHRTATGLLSAQRPDGELPGRLLPDWSPGADWICLTGNAQIAACWFLLHQASPNPAYLEAGRRATQMVRRTVNVAGDASIRGGVKGSHPVNGAYGRYQYLNWAAKFLVDACFLDADLKSA
ncbi:MAG: hypothetical protein AB7L66_17245 [Gemmatimonadales bacterium]